METLFLLAVLILCITGALLLSAGAVALADEIARHWRHARYTMRVRARVRREVGR